MDLKPQSDAQKESQKQEEGVDSMEYSRDETYYFEDGNVVLLVQNRLFKIHRTLFKRNSMFFNTLFSLPQEPETQEGTSDENPIICQDSVEDFQALCWTVYASPPEIYAQQSPATIDVPNLVAVLDICHKYDLVALRDWALDVLGNYSLAYSDTFVLKCGSWARVGRILTFAAICKRDGLAQRIEAIWLQSITNKEFIALEQALTTAEGCHELRKFHGRVYYTYFKASKITDRKSQNGEAMGINDVAKYADEAMTKLNDKRRSRLCQGLWSMLSLRPRLLQAPILEDNPECTVHPRRCMVIWHGWWDAMFTEWKESLDDPVEFMGKVQQRLSNPLTYRNRFDDTVGPPPCDVLIRTQARQMVDAFFDSLADRFAVP